MPEEAQGRRRRNRWSISSQTAIRKSNRWSGRVRRLGGKRRSPTGPTTGTFPYCSCLHSLLSWAGRRYWACRAPSTRVLRSAWGPRLAPSRRSWKTTCCRSAT